MEKGPNRIVIVVVMADQHTKYTIVGKHASSKGNGSAQGGGGTAVCFFRGGPSGGKAVRVFGAKIAPNFAW